MRSLYRIIMFGCVPFLIIVMLAACSKPEKETHASKKQNNPQIQVSDNTVETTQQEHSEIPVPSNPDSVKPKKSLEISSPAEQQSEKQVSSGSGSTQASGKNSPEKKPGTTNKYNITAPFDRNRLTLMGYEIGGKQEAIVKQFGKPKSQYTIEDPAQPITVYTYPGFSFGFVAQDGVKFIDVQSDQVNPGLNGVKIGSSVQDTIRLLGKPATDTDYVLTYSSQNIVLKLDIDPSKQTVISIKLFEE